MQIPNCGMQVWPAGQPQVPPQPSSFPHCCGLHVGVHAPQWPFASHCEPPAQVPHEPPQPSSPHCLPLQFGVHAPHWPVVVLQAWPAPQKPQALPQAS